MPSSALLTLSDRAASTAHRLLSGVGAASLVAYRHDPESSLDVLAHGLTADGHLLIALRADSVPAVLTADRTQVRFDVRREATEAQVRIVAATAHLLGQVTWIGDSVRQEALAGGILPDAVAMVADAPGTLLGLIRCERVLLHDASGVTPFPYADLVAQERPQAFPTTLEEIDAQEVLSRLGDTELRALCSAVVDGPLAGCVLSERPTRPGCDSTLGRVFCVDVDALGVNLMHVDHDVTRVVYLQFPQPVRDLPGLRRQVAELRSVVGAQRGA